MPPASAIFASAKLSRQLAVQRSGTIVPARPDEQFAPNSPTLKALSLYIVLRPAATVPTSGTKTDFPPPVSNTLARHGESTRGDRRTGSERKNRRGACAGLSARASLPRHRRNVPGRGLPCLAPR